MKSNKEVFLLKCSTLSSKIFTFSLNFSSDTTAACTKNNDSFWILKNKKHTNTVSTPLNLKNLTHFEISKKNTKSIDILKLKLIIKKRDTSSIEITKNVNYFNYIPNVLKKNASMGEDISINFNYTPYKKEILHLQK
ncbi:hypothetical protein [Polaribacter vadi]|uniref:hypothetical protein n=1 Tax=Polaribacter vadi TaxID=1774273 RepID=UPI0030EB7EBB|tara:strand:- start:1668 stop:2078 length:411 start_codon:yes stop_codon:yes gene_type:complete